MVAFHPTGYADAALMPDLRSRLMRAMRLRDFVLAFAVVLSLNLVPLSHPVNAWGRTPRIGTYNQAMRRLRDVPPQVSVSLAILGDSRVMFLEAADLCFRLERRDGACVNLASVGGEWDSVVSLGQHLEPYLGANALILLEVSDYWLEAGNASRLELLPRNRAYADLGQPELALASYFPMSVMRSGRMLALHDVLARSAEALRNRFSSEAPSGPLEYLAEYHTEKFRANVDSWFSYVSDQTRAERRELARRTFAQFAALPADVVLLYMPNAPERDEYVAARYPGRTERFFEVLKTLADEAGLPLVDLTGELPERERYRDFHHLNPDQSAVVSALIAKRLRELPRGG